MKGRNARIKEIIYSVYHNVFDFSIIKAVNTKEQLSVSLTIKKSPNALPTKIGLWIRDGNEYSLEEEK